MALTISEDWVRQRVQLKHSNLEDVKSLSLPGTYHEKIGSLDTALRHFSRLKHLDLSRNAIGSLQGLENLKLLEKLNVYYNSVSTLEELYRLRHNSKLQELDLRLNPVARNEPDYRLFLIHMLPNLRRLDDRSVRDNERKAALMHFSSEQATELTGRVPKPVMQMTERQPNPRVEHVKTLPKPSAAIDMEDDEAMDLVHRTNGDLRQPRKVTGSVSKEPAVEDYPSEAVRQMDKAATNQSHPTRAASDPVSTRSMGPCLPYMNGAFSTEELLPAQRIVPLTDAQTAMQAKYPNIPIATATGDSAAVSADANFGGTDSTHLTSSQETKKHRVQFAADPNLRFQDEIEAYTSYKAQGHFTPHPEPSSEAVVAHDQPPTANSAPAAWQPSQASAELYNAPQQVAPVDVTRLSASRAKPSFHMSTVPYEESVSTESRDRYQLEESNPAVIARISDLVDKYWNGAQSLLSNQKFKDQVWHFIQECAGGSEVFDVSNQKLEGDLKLAQEENIRLQKQLSNHSNGASSYPGGLKEEDSKTNMSLVRAQRDISILKSRLQASLEENRSLQNRLADFESSASGTGISAFDARQKETLEEEISNLRQEVAALTARLRQSAQLQELANMLQESHKSLVKTNEHLLKELDQTKQRHHAEVNQLHWSYDQLKRTIDSSLKGN